MKALPFVVTPAERIKRRIGTEASGVLEFEVRGGLTVAESATISELLANEPSTFVRAAQIADGIAKAEDISLLEAFSVVEKAAYGQDLEDGANQIRIKHAKAIEEVVHLFAASGQRNMEASVTALVRCRLSMADWSMEDTRRMDRVLFNGIWQLIVDEQKAEELEVSKPNEEELGKQRQANGSSRKRNGIKSSGSLSKGSQASSIEQPLPLS